MDLSWHIREEAPKSMIHTEELVSEVERQVPAI